MICKVCGSEFNIENFDVCPYCMTPIEQLDVVESCVEEICDNVEEVECIEESIEVEEQPEVDQCSEELKYLEEDFEITEADLIEEKDVQEDFPIEELGLSVRALNAFRRVNIHTLNSLIEFLATNDISEIKNVGAKTIQETEELMRRVGAGEILFNREGKEPEVVTYPFENMSPDLDYLSIGALTEFGFKMKTISKFAENGVRYCGALRNLSKNEINNFIGNRLEDKILMLAEYLNMDILALTTYIFDNNRNKREFNVFLRRAKGETLQEIAENPQGDEDPITRERVRQLERSCFKSIVHFVKELLYICKGGDKFISVQDLLEIFYDDEYDQVLLYTCKLIDEFEYLDFADMVIEKRETEAMEGIVFSIIRDIVGEGADLLMCENSIEEALLECDIDYIGIEAIKNLLKKYNYHFYGDFVTRGKCSYATICMYIIKQHFSDGIKLSQSEGEQSEDLKKLREIVDSNYSGIELPRSDRALSSTLVRTGLVLRGRGRYILEEQVVFDEEIMTEIKEYIDNCELNRVFYKEIYSEFEGVLNMICGVDNYNYLHGILALRFPTDYKYSRDYLLKNGVSESSAESIPDRIYNYICKIGRPVSKSELEQEFRGFSNVMILNSFANDNRLFQWEYNYFACTGILNISSGDILKIEKVLESIFEENRGYASDQLLFDRIKAEHPFILETNNIKSPMNLHYVVACLLADRMDFKRPHIARKGCIDLSTTKSVILYLLDYPEQFSYEQYMKLVSDMGWSYVTASAVLCEIEHNYARISIENYLLKEKLDVQENIQRIIKDIIVRNMDDGVLPIANLEFEEFPDWSYDWNEFLLETFVEKCFEDIVVVQPAMKDRRYQKGILVMSDKGLKSYPQVVAHKMKQYGYETLSESQFFSFLVVNNLARKVIPNELGNNEYIKKTGDKYSLIY